MFTIYYNQKELYRNVASLDALIAKINLEEDEKFRGIALCDPFTILDDGSRS